MVICIVLIVLGALGLGLFLMQKIKAYSVKAVLFKSFTSLMFIGVAVYSSFQNGNQPISVFFIMALVLDLLGDIYLDLKYVFPEQNRIFTYAGFVAFGIGHILYIFGMMKYLPYDHQWYSYVIPFVLGLIGGLLVVLLEKPLKLKYGEYKLICWIYGTLLFTMTFTAAYIGIATSFQAPMTMLLIGGILFAVSDLILSGTYFGEGKERPIDIVSNSITYYAAQFLIAFSLFFM